MTPETATQAVQLLRDIEALKVNVYSVTEAMDSKNFLAGCPMPTDNPTSPIDLPALSVDESRVVLDAVLKVVQTRLTAAQEKLAAL